MITLLQHKVVLFVLKPVVTDCNYTARGVEVTF